MFDIIYNRKKPLGRDKGRWKDNIKTYMKRIVCGGVA
jgi:hypothetical protein